MDLSSSESIALDLTTPSGFCALTYDPLDVSKIIDSVKDNAAGATAVFIGTTRNTFEGKIVTRLDYMAYSKLALKTMKDIMIAAEQNCLKSGDASRSLLRCAIHHRLGTVDVGQPSIVIAVSSPHRKEAFVACEYILEQVKLKAQIWKREVYEDLSSSSGDRDDVNSSAQWKTNNDAYNECASFVGI